MQVACSNILEPSRVERWPKSLLCPQVGALGSEFTWFSGPFISLTSAKITLLSLICSHLRCPMHHCPLSLYVSASFCLCPSVSFCLCVSLWLCLYLSLSWKTTLTLWSKLRCSSLATCHWYFLFHIMLHCLVSVLLLGCNPHAEHVAPET